MFKDLNDFIAALDRGRELARIPDPVSPDLEISAVTDRVSKSPGGGPALLFERPTGFDMPVAVNLFGSMTRVCMALGVQTLDDLATEIDELATPKIPTGMLDALKLLPAVNRLRDLLPKTVKDGACQEVVQKNGTLDDIPILDFDRRNEAKRFIILIDTLYESHVKLVASAAAEPTGLYLAQAGREAFEFDRTVSRLIEMRSEEYLALPHGRADSAASGDATGLVET